MRHTLHDLAAQLVQADTGKGEELRALSGQIARAMEQEEGYCRDLLRQAAEIILRISEGRSDHTAAEWEQAGKLIEQAIDQKEGMHDNVPVHPAMTPMAAPKGIAVEFTLPAGNDADLLLDFATESLEYVEIANAALMELEKDHGNIELLDTVFRTFHTIKGTSAFIDLDPITTMAHQVESVLVKIREGRLPFDSHHADIVLESLDVLKHILLALRSAKAGDGLLLPERYGQVMAGLRMLQDGNRPGAPLTDAAVPSDKTSRQPAPAPAAENGGAAHPGSAIQQTIRIQTGRLDRLIDTVGELVIAHFMVSQDPLISSQDHHDLAKKVVHTGKIVRELQELTMLLRIVPLKALFQRMGLLVRDLARKAGKQVTFVTEGEDTEIDRSMVDALSEPLLHLLRNALDHGMETAAERMGAGKPGTGIVRLSAVRSGGNIVFEISDDGRGLDRDRIAKKAMERGLITSAEGLTDAEIYECIFLPGFTTAERITEISGRGIGMDVARRGIESLHGRIYIRSAPNRGCVFTIRVPLTMAITDGMVLKVGSERYILPTVNIQVTFRPIPGQLYSVAGRGEIVDFRGSILPVVRLHRLLGISDARQLLSDGLLVVITDGSQRCALFIDELLGQIQVVTKTLGEAVGKMPYIAGGAIMSDDRVGLILDPIGLLSTIERKHDTGAVIPA